MRTKSLDRLLPRYQQSLPTYEQLGATERASTQGTATPGTATPGTLPVGYHLTQHSARLGIGVTAFEQASTALMSWDMQRRCGLAVTANGPVELGRTVVLGLGLGLRLVIPCRVIYVIDEPRRRGFGYGTLPDHPEQGEEAFVVSRDDRDVVWVDITAFSRPGAAIVRWAGPLGHLVQSIATRQYARALRAAAALPSAQPRAG